MKKLLLSVFAIASFSGIYAQCNELFISEYVEGSGNDKAIEIFNPTNSAISLTGYRLERFSNGSSSSSSGGVLNLSGTVAPHDVFVIVNGQTTTSTSPPSPPASPALQAMADQLDGIYPAPTYMNGNDAIVLYKNSTIVDIFGKTGQASMLSSSGWSDAPPYDGSSGSGAIWTENHTLIRKSGVMQGVTTNPSTFIVTTEWDSLSVNTWTELGSHACSCPTSVNEIDNSVSVIAYPNPSTAGSLTISSSEVIMNVEIYNVIGQEMIRNQGNNTDKQMQISTEGFAKGIYIVKAHFENNRTTVVKLNIQ